MYNVLCISVVYGVYKFQEMYIIFIWFIWFILCNLSKPVKENIYPTPTPNPNLRDAKELEQGDEKGNLARKTKDRSGSRIAEEERMNDSYAKSIKEIDGIDSDSEKSSEDMINDCHS